MEILSTQIAMLFLSLLIKVTKSEWIEIPLQHRQLLVHSEKKSVYANLYSSTALLNKQFVLQMVFQSLKCFHK